MLIPTKEFGLLLFRPHPLDKTVAPTLPQWTFFPLEDLSPCLV